MPGRDSYQKEAALASRERAGNPSSRRCLLAWLITFTGLPPGVLNVVQGTIPTVNAICDRLDIKAVSLLEVIRLERTFITGLHPLDYSFAGIFTTFLWLALPTRECSVAWMQRTMQSSCQTVGLQSI
jgi:hypothetical protein